MWTDAAAAAVARSPTTANLNSYPEVVLPGHGVCALLSQGGDVWSSPTGTTTPQHSTKTQNTHPKSYQQPTKTKVSFFTKNTLNE